MSKKDFPLPVVKDFSIKVEEARRLLLGNESVFEIDIDYKLLIIKLKDLDPESSFYLTIGRPFLKDPDTVNATVMYDASRAPSSKYIKDAISGQLHSYIASTKMEEWVSNIVSYNSIVFSHEESFEKLYEKDFFILKPLTKTQIRNLLTQTPRLE